MKLNLDELERKMRSIAEWDEARDVERDQCVGCKSSVYKPSDLDPSPLCNQCAQEHARETAPVMLALISRIRELDAFVDAIPDESLQACKLYREQAPGLYTDDDGNALYMDEAKHRILARGTVLP